MWFRFRSIIIGGYYLSPHITLEICMYKVLTAEKNVQRFGHSSQVLLAGGLNVWARVQEGDTTTNPRAPPNAISCQTGFRRLRLIDNRYIFESHACRSTIDRIYGSGRMLESYAVTQVYADVWTATSDHRLLACKVQVAGGQNQRVPCAHTSGGAASH